LRPGRLTISPRATVNEMSSHRHAPEVAFGQIGNFNHRATIGLESWPDVSQNHVLAANKTPCHFSTPFCHTVLKPPFLSFK
jgi:hypothetical protein